MPHEDHRDKQDWRAIAGVLFISSVLYGIHLAVGSSTLYWNQRKQHTLSRQQYLRNLFYIAVYLLFGTINMFSIIATYGTWDSDKKRIAFGTLFMVATIVVTLGAGSFLLLRCYLLWDCNKWFLVIPASLLLATGFVGFYRISDLSESAPDLSPESVLSLCEYWALALTVNILLTSFIIVKIIFARRSINTIIRMSELNDQLRTGKRQRTIEDMKSTRDTYTSTLCLLIESSALYTIAIAISVGVTFGVKSIVVSPIVVQTECIASELIILRAVFGKGWTPSTLAAFSPDHREADTDSAKDVEKGVRSSAKIQIAPGPGYF